MINIQLWEELALTISYKQICTRTISKEKYKIKQKQKSKNRWNQSKQCKTSTKRYSSKYRHFRRSYIRYLLFSEQICAHRSNLLSTLQENKIYLIVMKLRASTLILLTQEQLQIELINLEIQGIQDQIIHQAFTTPLLQMEVLSNHLLTLI